MSLANYLMGIGIQVLIWPLIYYLSIVHFKWILRRRRAQGNLSNSGHYSELIIVVAVVSILIWTAGFLRNMY
jgi:hypothetical protein